MGLVYEERFKRLLDHLGFKHKKMCNIDYYLPNPKFSDPLTFKQFIKLL